MKSIICYYSGSGNTKLACEYITNRIKNVNFDFFDIRTGNIPDLKEVDVVGFSTFANFLSPPYLFTEFVNKLPQQNSKPVFLLNTYGMFSGKTLKIMEKNVLNKGFKVISGFSLHTPENYPPMISKGMGNEQAPNVEEIKSFDEFISQLGEILTTLSEGKEFNPQKVKIGILGHIVPAFPIDRARKDMGIKFVDEKLCIKCGLCKKECPYGAIELNPLPAFDMTKCYGCWSCYNKCPQKAIYTKKLRGVAQYPQPIPELVEKLS